MGKSDKLLHPKPTPEPQSVSSEFLRATLDRDSLKILNRCAGTEIAYFFVNGPPSTDQFRIVVLRVADSPFLVLPRVLLGKGALS